MEMSGLAHILSPRSTGFLAVAPQATYRVSFELEKLKPSKVWLLRESLGLFPSFSSVLFLVLNIGGTARSPLS